MAAPLEQLGLREVMKLVPVRRLWMAQVVSVFGDFLAIFAVFSIVSFRMRAPAGQVSLILVAYFLPLVFISPFAGVLVDSWNVKRTMILSDLIRAVLALLLLAAGNLYSIYAILFAISAVSSFFMPAQQVAIRTLVPREGMLSANALFQQAFQVMQILSPAIAGALVAAFRPESCFWIDSASFLFSAAAVFTIAIVREPAPHGAQAGSVFSSMLEGLRFIVQNRAISFVILSMAAGLFAIRCYSALVAVYVRDVLREGTSLFGILGSLVGIGMIAGTQLIHRAGRNRSRQRLVVYGLFGVAASIALLAAVGTKAAAVAGTLGIGFFVAFVIVPCQTLMLEETPPHLIGRIGGTFMSVIFAAQVAALAGSGTIANRLGIRNLYLAAAFSLAAIAALGLLWTARMQSASAQPALEADEV